MPRVISIKTFYTSKRTSVFTFLLFFKRTFGLYKKNLSSQLSNSSTNFGLGIKQPEFQTKSKVAYKKIQCISPRRNGLPCGFRESEVDGVLPCLLASARSDSSFSESASSTFIHIRKSLLKLPQSGNWAILTSILSDLITFLK